MESIVNSSHAVLFEKEFENLKLYLRNNAYSKVFVLTDENTGKYCLPVLQDALLPEFTFDLIEVPSGEQHKTIDFCLGIWKTLLDFGADRHSLLINLGGGVITDMGGFVASTYKRGIDFVHLPTTLLSQVDASVGGKTGVDLDAVKNIIGTFTQPKAVFIYPEFIQTLENRQLVSGFAEMVKHGLIRDHAYFQSLKAFESDTVIPEWIHRSVKIKSEVVDADPTEKNLRKILNFGHTLGHAIETYSLDHDQEPLLHGEAIAVGMICESFLSYLICGLPESSLNEISDFIRSVFPSYRYTPDMYAELFRIMQNDKKNMGGQISFSLLKEIGECHYNLHPTEGQIVEALEFYREGTF